MKKCSPEDVVKSIQGLSMTEVTRGTEVLTRLASESEADGRHLVILSPDTGESVQVVLNNTDDVS